MLNSLFKIKNVIFLFLLWNIFVGCSSIVYSPTIDLPARPLKKGQGQFVYGVGMLAETRPKETGKKLDLGHEIFVRYGFGENFSFQEKVWADISEIENKWRGGISASGIFVLNDSTSKFRFGVMPTLAFLFDGKPVEGGGGAVPIILWFPRIETFHFYTAMGPAIGLRDAIGKKKPQWGWGIVTNVGFSAVPSSVMSINVEIVGILQVNEYDKIIHFIIAPGVKVGWNF
jgi:hypothetical protein